MSGGCMEVKGARSIILLRGYGPEGVRFLVSGAANTATTYLLYVLLLDWIGYAASYTISYAVGIVLAYFLNCLFVFRSKLSLGKFLSFPLVYLVQYLGGMALLYLLVDVAGMNPKIAPALVIAATIPVTFLLSRRILRDKTQRPEK